MKSSGHTSQLPHGLEITSLQDLTETLVSGHTLHQGKMLALRQDTVRLPDGKLATRDYLLHPGAAMIIPRFPDGRLLMERQFRYPMGRIFIEFPAGKIDAAESPLETAQRELREETGYRANLWRPLTTIHNAIAYSNEAIHLFLAEDLHYENLALDEGEFLECFTCFLPELLEAIAAGQITDVKTVIGALYLARWHG